MLPNLDDFAIDRTTIPQDRLNITAKTRSNLLPWNGQFSPQLVHALLSEFSSVGELVFDPFVGSGTVLVESARLHLRALGTEINPAAFKMAAIYRFINMPSKHRETVLRHCRDILDDALPNDFFASLRGTATEERTKASLVDICRQQIDDNIRTMLEALIVRLDFFKPGLDQDRVFSTWSRLEHTISHLPYSAHPIDLIHCDARAVPAASGIADCVLTSPPYINVFNYHQQYRRSVESLGWDLLHVAKSEIGSNRKFRGNRFLTVIQYCLDIAQVLREMRRICKSDARLMLVVGRESNVRKTAFYNADIVTKIGLACEGFECALRQERVFVNKFGSAIYEDIIHLVPSSAVDSRRTAPRDIAHAVFCDALKYAPSDSREDLAAALDSIDDVSPSPHYSVEARCEKATTI